MVMTQQQALELVVAMERSWPKTMNLLAQNLNPKLETSAHEKSVLGRLERELWSIEKDWPQPSPVDSAQDFATQYEACRPYLRPGRITNAPPPFPPAVKALRGAILDAAAGWDNGEQRPHLNAHLNALLDLLERELTGSSR